MEDLHNDAITIVVHHDNIHAYDAIVKAITDAACKQAENYHVKIEVITKVEYLILVNNRLYNQQTTYYGKTCQNKIGDVDFVGLLHDSADIQFKK